MKHFVYILTLLLLCSCASSRNDSIVNQRDSINIIDSTRYITKYQLIDSIRWIDSTTTVVDEQGNIKKQEKWHIREKITVSHDTVTIEKIKNNYINRRITKKIYIKQKLSFMDKIKMKYGSWCFGLLVMVLLALAIKHVPKIINFIRKFI